MLCKVGKISTDISTDEKNNLAYFFSISTDEFQLVQIESVLM